MTATAIRSSCHTPARAARHRRRGALLLLAAGVLLATAVDAMAWGALGHRLVARLAESSLDAQAQAEVARLLRGEADPSLAGIAAWADELRSTDPDLGRRSARWHYVNIDDPGCNFDPQADCRGGNCIVTALETQTAILADPARSDEERRQALKFVVHFVGDLHQPLHAGRGHDRGGNDYQVNWNGKGSNLHSLWDSGLLRSTGFDEDAWLARLRALPSPPAEALVPPHAAPLWARESCLLVGSRDFYPPAHKVDPGYADDWLPVTGQQLRLAGERLAAVLNAALGQSSAD